MPSTYMDNYVTTKGLTRKEKFHGREKLVMLTAGFLGRCGLDYHEADDLVDFAEHMNHTRITKRVSSDIVNTIIIEARKEAKDSCNSTAHIDERVVENFRRIATREQA